MDYSQCGQGGGRLKLNYCFFYDCDAGWPFETVFQSLLGRLLKKGRKRKERIDENENVQESKTSEMSTQLWLKDTIPDSYDVKAGDPALVDELNRFY